MFQMFEIQCVLKLRKRSLVFLWVEASILMDVNISLMPLLMELLPKETLYHERSLPIPRSAALVLVMPPMPIYLDLRRTCLVALEA